MVYVAKNSIPYMDAMGILSNHCLMLHDGSASLIPAISPGSQPIQQVCLKKIQGSLYYQPKQCIVRREIPQNYHRCVLFDSLQNRYFHVIS